MMEDVKSDNPILQEGLSYWRVFTDTLDETYIEKCLECFLCEAQAGNPEAMWLAGEVYYGFEIDLYYITPENWIDRADFVPSSALANWEQAAYWLGEGTMLGSVEAKYRYAHLLYYGHGVHKSYEAALQLFTQVDEHLLNGGTCRCGSRKSGWYIQDILLDCPGVHRDVAAALPYIDRMAQSPDSVEAISIALMHLGGQLEAQGGPKYDPLRAIELLTSAWLNRNDPWAAYWLSEIYANGREVPKDSILACYWQNLAGPVGKHARWK